MAIVVKINERKEPINELLGTLLAWGLVAGLMAKIFGFKFNLTDTDEMRSWGVQLGDAFKYSRQKVKKIGLDPETQQMVERLLQSADEKIRRVVQRQSETLTRTPSAPITADTEITRICDETERNLDSLIKDPRKAKLLVDPLRDTFNNLRTGLDTARRNAVIAALRSDPAVRTAIVSSLPSGTPPATIDSIMNSIAMRVI
jgi:hypothetical protein